MGERADAIPEAAKHAAEDAFKRRLGGWQSHYGPALHAALAAAAPLLPGGGEAEARLAGLRARNAMLEGEVERLRSARPDAETVARAVWDARETKDPSGERTGCTEDDEAREPVFWDQAVAEDRWPGSRRDQLEEARLVLDMLGRPLDARSGADTVKLADVLARLRHMADVVQDREVAATARTLRTAANVLETEFASGADRPEGSQT